jgi:hypothetical protein
MGELQATLTAFPRAQKVTVSDVTHSHESWGDEEEAALVQWLREGGRGRNTTTLTSTILDSCSYFVNQLVRGGALPLLRCVGASLKDEAQRAPLTEGLLRDTTELHLAVGQTEEAELATLGLVQQLPSLTTLELELPVTEVDQDAPVQWPPFTPPNLTALRTQMRLCECPTANKSLLCGLPCALGASGARLERLEVKFPTDFKHVGDGLVHVAQALRCCSAKLERFVPLTSESESLQVGEGAEDGDFETRIERLRVQWADVLAGVSACRELQVLVLPYTDATFHRLTHLEILAYERGPGVVGLWELVASGGLPALAKPGASGPVGGERSEGRSGTGTRGGGRHPEAPLRWC